MPGNPQLDNTTVSLGIECTEIVVEQPAGVSNPHVIDAPPAPDWTLTLKFLVGGMQAHGFHNVNIPGEVTFYYEGFGPDPDSPEGKIGPIPVSSTAGNQIPPQPNLPSVLYEYEVASPPQPANLLPGGAMCKLSAVVSFPTWNMNAFIEGQSISQASP